MAAYLIRRLEHFTKLSRDDRGALEGMAASSVRHLARGEDVVREGDEPRHVNLILDGWASRYKTLEDGRRQIAAFLLPGDICDARNFILNHMDHSIGALSALTVAQIPRSAILDLPVTHPRIDRALWWSALVGESIQREWSMSLGQRDAVERVAHLFCETFVRLRAVGLTRGNTCELPVTQSELGEATGLSTVHVNRTLQDLRARSLITLKDRTLAIPDLGALQSTALFDVGYLHLDRPGREFDANDD